MFHSELETSMRRKWSEEGYSSGNEEDREGKLLVLLAQEQNITELAREQKAEGCGEERTFRLSLLIHTFLPFSDSAPVNVHPPV
jgi:hypothetical protein